MSMSLELQAKTTRILADSEAAIKRGDHATARRLHKEFDRLVDGHAGERLRESRAEQEEGMELMPTIAGQQDSDGRDGPQDFSRAVPDTGAREWRSDETWSEWAQRSGRPPVKGRLADFLRAAAFGVQNEREEELMAESRAQLVGSDTAGGYLVPTQVATSIFDPLRSATTVVRAGARSIPVGPDQKWPVQTGDPTVSTHGEGQTISTTEITIGRLEPPIHTFSAIVKASREVLEDAPGLDDLVRRSYSAVAALKVDEMALYGLGAAGEPMGVSNFSNRATVDLSSTKLSANGHYDVLLDLRGEIMDANGGEPRAAIMSTREDRVFAKLKDGEGNPAQVPPALERVRRFATTQVKTDEGTGSNESRIFMGDFSRLDILLRSDVMVTPLRERYADTGEVGFWFWLRFGIMSDHEEHFGTADGIVPE